MNEPSTSNFTGINQGNTQGKVIPNEFFGALGVITLPRTAIKNKMNKTLTSPTMPEGIKKWKTTTIISRSQKISYHIALNSAKVTIKKTSSPVVSRTISIPNRTIQIVATPKVSYRTTMITIGHPGSSSNSREHKKTESQPSLETYKSGEDNYIKEFCPNACARTRGSPYWLLAKWHARRSFRRPKTGCNLGAPNQITGELNECQPLLLCEVGGARSVGTHNQVTGELNECQPVLTCEGDLSVGTHNQVTGELNECQPLLTCEDRFVGITNQGTSELKEWRSKLIPEVIPAHLLTPNYADYLNLGTDQESLVQSDNEFIQKLLIYKDDDTFGGSLPLQNKRDIGVENMLQQNLIGDTDTDVAAQVIKHFDDYNPDLNGDDFNLEHYTNLDKHVDMFDTLTNLCLTDNICASLQKCDLCEKWGPKEALDNHYMMTHSVTEWTDMSKNDAKNFVY